MVKELRINEPTKVLIPKDLTEIELSQLKAGLTYTNKSALFQLQRLHANARWYEGREDEYQEQEKELKKQAKVCLLFEENEHYWTWSGLTDYVAKKLRAKVINNVVYPKAKLLPWDKKPTKVMYPFQEESHDNLLKVRHGGVQIGTGLGKSLIIINLIKSLGLKTLVMSPSTSISNQLYKELLLLFGKKNVGRFFGGKKESKKLIVVGNAQSLTRVVEGSEDWKNLASSSVFIADESHQCPASTLAKVCFGLVSQSPYRFFFSATQMRNDGSDLLLDGITGPIVYEMTVRQGIEQGYLAKPVFKMFEVKPNGEYFHPDPNVMTRHHLYYNPEIVKTVGKLVNAALDAGLSTLVLIEEVEQFTKLLPYLKHEVGFAHGPLTENKDKVPSEYHDSDPDKLVEDFNSGKLKFLVGTSCISTGTDIQPVKFMVYWQGGSSEVQVKQAIGRTTRKPNGKTFCHVVDFMVNDETMDSNGNTKNGPVGRHCMVRKEIYDDIYGPVTFARM
jgi:superfamily II DNA or RNA helicase